MVTPRPPFPPSPPKIASKTVQDCLVPMEKVFCLSTQDALDASMLVGCRGGMREGGIGREGGHREGGIEGT